MGSGSTTRLALEYPEGTDPAAIPTDVEGLANGLDGIVAPWVQSSSAPVSPTSGQLWWNPTVTASTFGMNYYDGTSWWNILSGPQFIGASAPAAALCYRGLIWVNTSYTCPQFQICTAGGATPTWLVVIPGSSTTGQTLINTGSGIQWGTYNGPPWLTPIITSGNLVATNGQYVEASASLTVTSPSNIAGNNFGAIANYAASNSSPVTVTAASGFLIGPGIPPSTSSIVLGAQNANTVFVADGTNWIQTQGAQDTGWISITPINGWSAGGAGRIPYYRAVGNIVYMTGLVLGGTSNTVAFALPSALAPAQQRDFVAFAYNTSGLPIPAAGAIIGSAVYLVYNLISGTFSAVDIDCSFPIN